MEITSPQENPQPSVKERYLQARAPAIALLEIENDLKDRFPTSGLPFSFSGLEALEAEGSITLSNESKEDPTEQDTTLATNTIIALTVDTANQLERNLFERMELSKDSGLLFRLVSVLLQGQRIINNANYKTRSEIIKKTIALRTRGGSRESTKIDSSQASRTVWWIIERLKENLTQEQKEKIEEMSVLGGNRTRN